MAEPYSWLLHSPEDGRSLWGAGTNMAKRVDPTDPSKQWDSNCLVKPMIGGYAAMCDIRDSLESAIAEAISSPNPPGQRGHVYISDWRLNPLRDLSDGSPDSAGDLINKWSTGPWSQGDKAVRDQTAIGFILRLMGAGVKVRVLLWLPYNFEPANFGAHLHEHESILESVLIFNSHLEAIFHVDDLGVVALDARLHGAFSSHHQKMLVIRGADKTHVAYCGGVDLAYTRRDAPPPFTTVATTDAVLGGDWQSGTVIPAPDFWPKSANVDYPFPLPLSIKPKNDLPDVYGPSNQHWHDQHLRLEGAIVETLEAQFAERWKDALPQKNVFFISGPSFPKRTQQNIVVLSGGLDSSHAIVALPDPSPVPNQSPGKSTLQMWRTIPVRPRTSDGSPAPIFPIGEFTNLAGIAKATKVTNNCIWIFDQYFWSVPVAKLFRQQMTVNPSLHLIVILPPFADSAPTVQHWARDLAIGTLYNCAPDQLPLTTTDSITSRIAIFNFWHTSEKRGIYVHAKVQMYDSSLLVCGSCNLNQRSLLNDSELDCAVLDSDVVIQHQGNLWKLLFPQQAPPAALLSSSGLNDASAGPAFFSAFANAASSSSSFLQPDQATPAAVGWNYPPGWVPRRSSETAYSIQQTVFDPHCLPMELVGSLDQVSLMLEFSPELTRRITK